jgi:regulator of cell morphogenesis and NO signaling
MNTIASIDAALTVNAIIARFPATVAVFNAHGIDACCGGAVPLDEAVRRDGAALDTVLADLREAIG